MPVTTYSATSCVSCGAPLDPPEGRRVVECGYCGRKLEVEGEHTRQVDTGGAHALTDELLRGYCGRDHGEGRRYGVAEMRARDWKCWERGVWPIDARASSRFGTGWSEKALVGAPRVYPRCGDRLGAWAPGTIHSHVEWVETHYDPDAPPVEAIRVFETCVPGATYAVTVREDGAEELLWQRKPERTGNTAQVLEVPLAPPRKLRAVRAYVKNDLGGQWTEIDTIGLVATTPVPLEMRRKPPRLRPLQKVLLLAAVAAAVLWLVTTLFAQPDASQGEPASAPIAVPPRVVANAEMKQWDTDLQGMTAAGTIWATSVAGRSSQYGASDWSATQVLGPPDVFPAHHDAKAAWAPREQDRGEEWIAVRFPGASPAGSVLVVETFHPGAIVRIDDLSDPRAPVALWTGTTSAPGQSRILSLELAAPRAISHLRVVLDTTRVRGWNEIDAIGLVPPL